MMLDRCWIIVGGTVAQDFNLASFCFQLRAATMAFPIWTTFFLLPTTYLVWVIHRLTNNYTVARRVGIPVVVIPVNPESPLWMLLSDYIGPSIDRILSWLPFGSGYFTRYAHRGWDVHDRAKSFLELGDAFILVTTGKNWLYICNAETLTEILQRRKEFERPLEIMGRGKRLAKTSKSYGSPLASRIWASSGRNVFARRRKCWSSGIIVQIFDKLVKMCEDSPSMSYRQLALCFWVRNFLQATCSGFCQKHWRLVGQATSTFKTHIAETIKEEIALMAKGKENLGNFISAMVRASEEATRVVDDSTGGHFHGLREDEVFGNIFVFNFAGHDSIAITLTYVITHLAAHPEIQDWLAAEIQYIRKDQGATSYRDAFPRLKRCTAVVYETLRTSTPFPAMVKNTGTQPRSLKVGDNTLQLPSGMNIITTFPSMHSHPRYWGDDADIWRPERWIETTDTASAGDSIFADEFLYTPHKGAFMPWSEGDRACPGKKFAQVELTGAVSVLFENYRVEPIPEAGESMENARERTKQMIEDSGMVLLIEMLHPEKVGLRWVKREAKI
ncbi:hypothetical protein HYALB_00005867 [Hymenoscyphus albidus]|uniref:Cytochrome P450 n=1 Tax=Hymenoscyphus albidus TaxID=595503 RepID=A0A9N9QB59_9HELO|nr:hypothetical protein HYALB_00005867 [Hymenoscyphus albidus]